MHRIGIEFLSVFSMPPPAFVNLAADLGVGNISLGLTGMPWNPHGYPTWSLREDAALRRELVAVLRDRGVSISLGEGFSVRPGTDLRERSGDLALMADLGVKRVNTVSLDPDMNRTLDQIALLAEMAAAAGMTETTVEFGPGMTIADLATAVTTVRSINRPDFRLLIDTMHLLRSGSTAADVAALDENMIGYIQLSDAPRTGDASSYMEEAMFSRRVPGTGELDLAGLVAVLPADRVYSLEVPQRALAEEGVGPEQRLAPCVAAAQALLAGKISVNN